MPARCWGTKSSFPSPGHIILLFLPSVSKHQPHRLSSPPLPDPDPIRCYPGQTAWSPLGTDFPLKGNWRAPAAPRHCMVWECKALGRPPHQVKTWPNLVPSTSNSAGVEFRGGRRVLWREERRNAPRDSDPQPHPRFRRGWRAAVLPGHEAGGHVGGIELCQ